ncbi:MAG: diguanylate cyclase domain-containing protein [Burkholderiaceae bacterium]
MNFQSIKFRIIALGVGLVLLGVLVRHFVAMPLFQERVRELVAAQQLSIASYVARDIDHSITSRLALIDRLAAELPAQLANQPDMLQSWVRDRQHINPMFNGGVIVVPADGHGLIAGYPVVSGRSRLDYAATDWFQAALQSNKPVMGKPYRGRASGDPIIVFAAPVRDAAGKPVMVLAGIALLTPGFLDRMQETQLGTSGGFLLISSSDQLFVGASDPGMILKPTPRPGVNLLHDRAMAGYRGTGITVNARGVEELSAMVSVPSTDWFVVVRMPTAEAFRPITMLHAFMIKASAFFLVMILAVLLIFLPRILRPLTDSARAIRDMADGRRELEQLPIVRNDEVGKLVSGFNFLVERLHKEQAAREASEAKLKFLAHHDSLTGLYNRAMLEDRLDQALARMERDGSQIALLFCDLDGFKAINDQHGHQTGDEILRQVARRLSEGRRRIDTVARLGGDEFVILLTGLSDARAAANLVAQQCLAAMSEPFEADGIAFKLGISIGIAPHAGPMVTPSYLIAQADIAMYQAKRGGKEKLFFIDEIGKPDGGPLAPKMPSEKRSSHPSLAEDES